MPYGGKRQGAGRKSDISKQKLAELYTKTLAEEVEKHRTGIIAALIGKAETGDIAAIKEIHERTLGKVKDELNLNASLKHSFDDISEDLYKAIIEREAHRVKVSGAE